MDIKVTYDPAKRDKALRARGLDFEDAPRLFAGFHLTRADLRKDYGEAREISVGQLGDDVVVMVWTARDDGRRIISMRKADRDEREDYFRERVRSG